MRNFLKILSVALLAALLSICVFADSYVTLYAPDGRTLVKPDSEVELYKSLGWYTYPVTKMYSLDGRTLICATANVENNKKVGWYTQPMTTMYAPDGRTLICPKANVETNKTVGWYEYPVTKMYSADGRTLICAKTNVESNKKVGWYPYPVTKMYSADGRTLVCATANVESNKKVGWYLWGDYVCSKTRTWVNYYGYNYAFETLMGYYQDATGYDEEVIAYGIFELLDEWYVANNYCPLVILDYYMSKQDGEPCVNIVFRNITFESVEYLETFFTCYDRYGNVTTDYPSLYNGNFTGYSYEEIEGLEKTTLTWELDDNSKTYDVSYPYLTYVRLEDGTTWYY
ncbi:MAG: hypothetical protein IJA60_06010 [Clostridia bacterium]|nr:hypothetical protein [Clostridia bacterium]